MEDQLNTRVRRRSSELTSGERGRLSVITLNQLGNTSVSKKTPDKNIIGKVIRFAIGAA